MESAITGGGGGISQADADARYVKLTGGTAGATASRQAFTNGISIGAATGVVFGTTISLISSGTDYQLSLAADKLTLVDGDTGGTARILYGLVTGTKDFTLPNASGTVVLATAVQTLTNKTLTTPVIADFTSAAHDHGDADDGGPLVFGCAAPIIGASVDLSAQAASIAATNLIAVPVTGLYRVSYWLEITQAATVSSSVALTIADSTGSFSTPANVSNTAGSNSLAGVGATATGITSWTVYVTAGAALTYATTYASTGGTPMQYRLNIAVERIQ